MQDDLVEHLEAKTILLVDDDLLMLSTIGMILENLGISNFEKAKNGKLALEILERKNVDLLLTDIQMPTMNGLELIKRIRCGQSSISRGLPAVIFTSFSTDETLRSALTLDVNGFLSKPVKPLALVQKIIQALAEKEQPLRQIDDYALVNTDLEALLAEKSADTAEKSTSIEANEQQVGLYGLKPNMRLSRNITHQNGSLLLSAGFLLHEGTINRLKDLSKILADEEFYIEVAAEE